MKRITPTWDIIVSIPFYEIAEYMSEEEYETVSAITADEIRIQLSFSYSPADREVGLSESFDFRKWNWADTAYSSIVERAINFYIADADMEEMYREQVKESMLDDEDYMKYGESL